jgi:hypothetical protein
MVVFLSVMQMLSRNDLPPDLIPSTGDPRQKEIVSMVARVGAYETRLLKRMGDVDRPERHLIHCRENMKHLPRLG